MVDRRELYRPWMIGGTVFNRMFHCGVEANGWLEHTMVHCLPVELLEQWQDRIAFLCADQRDAFRVNRSLREQRELIVLSEHVVPGPGLNEADPSVRYFMFVCLHELVHAIKQHKPPNEITPEENAAQEAEADELALQWINDYLQLQAHPDIPLLTREEIGRAQARHRELMLNRANV